MSLSPIGLRSSREIIFNIEPLELLDPPSYLWLATTTLRFETLLLCTYIPLCASLCPFVCVAVIVAVGGCVVAVIVQSDCYCRCSHSHNGNTMHILPYCYLLPYKTHISNHHPHFLFAHNILLRIALPSCRFFRDLSQFYSHSKTQSCVSGAQSNLPPFVYRPPPYLS